MTQFQKVAGTVVSVSFIFGVILGWFGYTDQIGAKRVWDQSQLVVNSWVENPLKVIVETGRWEVPEELFTGKEPDAGKLNTRLLAVVLNEDPYALIQQSGAGELEVIKVSINDLVEDYWQVSSISEVSVLLVHDDEENNLLLFKGVDE